VGRPSVPWIAASPFELVPMTATAPSERVALLGPSASLPLISLKGKQYVIFRVSKGNADLD
jgi:hypothetical protein